MSVGRFDPTRQALFNRRLADAGVGAPTPPHPVVGRRTTNGPAPLSFAQQRLWFLDQLEPSSAAYNVLGVLRLHGPLEIARLQQAVFRIVERHEVLRTTFEERDGLPVQLVASASPPAIDLVDLSALDEGGSDTEVEARARHETSTPFHLQQGPLVRLTLLRRAADDHVLLFCLHHIVSDQWSLGLLAGELGAFYARPDAALAPLPIQYGDYAAWQRDWKAGPEFAREIEWWRRRLSGLSAVPLPTDRHRPAARSYRGAAHAFAIGMETRRAVEIMGRSAGATPFMTLLALFQVLLARETRQTDIAVGTPIANRSDAALQPLVGFFTNTLVIRSHLDRATSVLEHLAAVRDECVAAYHRAAIPFEALVEALQPERELNRHPLFDTMFVLQTPLPAVELPGLGVTFLDQPVVTSKFDLTLTMRETPDGRYTWLEYSTDLFDAATIERLASRFHHLLIASTASPCSRLDELPMMSADERDRIVRGLNATQRDFGGDELVHHLVEAQAMRTPDATAVRFLGGHLTYRELDDRANRLARYLARLGAGPDIAVGICLERSLDAIVAVLAVMKAGAAYLPLDPSYPIDRLDFMVADAGARILVVDGATRDRFPADARRLSVCLADAQDTIDAERATQVESGVSADNVLYFMYTSGSTGRPKGAMLSHRSLYNLVRWHLDTLVTGAATLQFAPLSFDASFHEIFAALASGGTLHLATEVERLDTDALVAHMSREGIAKIILPVVAFQQLAALYADAPESLHALREIAVTGEQLLLTPAILQLCARLPRCVLHNHYGPSETHVITSYTFDGPPGQLLPPPPIGVPIANTAIYLLDDRLNPAPVGVPGELHVGGVSLARGYCGRADLTAERFVPDPFTSSPGARMYRTGDLARYLPNGNIEFLGRIDSQMKVRGHRVEPGEIETVLSKHPAVSQSAVVLREVVPGNPGLVAFIVPADRFPGVGPPWNDLVAFLSAALPAPLVPSHFVAVDSLPLTPSGKVDRSALPTPHRESSDQFVAPTRPADRWMAAQWADLLGLSRVGTADHFFALGGHSLLATRLISRVRRDLQVDVPVRLVFEQPVLERFVAAIAPLAGGDDTLDVVADTLLEVDALSDAAARARLNDLRAREP